MTDVKPRNSNHSQARIHRRWPQNEVTTLMEVVARLSPKTKEDWTKVCMEMHKRDFRHTVCDYKAKFNNQIAKQQRTSLKQNQQQYTRICQLFHQGKTSTQIAAILDSVTPTAVETTIKGLLSMMNKTIARVVGKSKAIQIKTKSHHFFRFLKQNRFELKSINQMEHICRYWKALIAETNKFKKKNQQKYELYKRTLEEKIRKYNDSVVNYTAIYQQYLKKHSNPSEEFKVKEEVKREKKAPTVASIYLKSVTECPDNYRQSVSMLTPEKINWEQNQKSVSLSGRLLNRSKDADGYFEEGLPKEEFLPTMNSFLPEQSFLDHIYFQSNEEINGVANGLYHYSYIQELEQDY